MEKNPPSPPSFLVFIALSALFNFSMFYRASTAVIAPQLVKDLRLDAETLGLLGGAFFYSFALFQIPVGPMLDRLGPRRVIGYLSLVGALGSIVFAISPSLSVALVGRILSGVGMASVLMGSLKVFALRFPPERFATLVGTFLSAGTLGNILAASPLAYLASKAGWRTAFLISGGLTAVVALAVLWILRKGDGEDHDRLSLQAATEGGGAFRSILLVVRERSFWQLGMASFFRYGTFVGLQGLWLGPYLMDIRGYSSVETGNILILLAIGVIVGGPIAGRLSDKTFQARKAVALGGMSFYCLSLFPLAGILDLRSTIGYGLIFFAMGFFNAFGMIIYSHAKELFPIAMSGTVTALVNFFSMIGGALLMPAMGMIIKSFPRAGNAYPAEAYHLAFLLCSLGMAASVVFYGFSKREK